MALPISSERAALYEVAKLINTNSVVMYSKTTCPFCIEAKALLKNVLGASYSSVKVIELDQCATASESAGQKCDPATATALRVLTGMVTVPNIFIGGKSIGGCSEVQEMNRTNQLRPLLFEVGAASIQAGDTIPSTTLRKLQASGSEVVEVKVVNSTEIFGGKTTMLFGLPAAFSPSCSDRHLPGYITNAKAFLDKGVDQIACVSVNDAFVLKAWAEKTKAIGTILFLSDGNGEFVRKLGLLTDASKGGMGQRSRRFAAIIRNNVVEHVAVDKPMVTEESTAEKMLPKLSKL